MARRRALALAAATGLHLASLQLGYLLTIQMHLSSGYLSYALVTALWMLGCLIGLWVALPAALAVIAGLASYLVTLVACNLAPFHPSLLWLAIPAVIVSGLWAGRFFCVALARDDGEGASARAFAGENTGFVAGLVGVFLGYALLGRALLLWAPLVTGASVLALLSRRGPALALLGLVLGGCVDEGPSVVPAPDRSLFATQAYPILLRDCGFPGCHGAEERYYQVFGPGRTRLAAPGEPPPGPFDLATPYELARSYDRARAALLTDGDVDDAPLLRKPLEEAGHAGRDVLGRNVYATRDEAGYRALAGWARGLVILEEEAP